MEPARVFYDGGCGLCKRTMATVRRHGAPGLLVPVDNGEPDGAAELERRGLLEASEHTLIVLVGERVFLRSAAVVQVAKRLRGWRRLGVAAWLLPKPARDWLYGQVAKRRDRSCRLPPARP